LIIMLLVILLIFEARKQIESIRAFRFRLIEVLV